MILNEKTLLLFYICVPGVICCIIIAVCLYMRCFAVSRRAPSKTVYHIKYIPDKVERVIEVIDFKSPLSKREKRKQRLKQLSQYRAALKVSPEISSTQEESKDANATDDIEEGLDEEDEKVGYEDEDDDVSFPPPMKRSASSSFFGASFRSLLSFAGNSSRSLLSKQSSFAQGSKKKKRSSIKRQSSTRSSGSSTKSKRFVSQDRIDRSEARKNLIRSSMQNIVEIIPEITQDTEENVVSILDIKRLQEQKAESIIERRRRIREEVRSQAISRGEMDVVELNSGPTADKIPTGYKMIEFIPNLSPEYLIYKRVLYKWEVAKKPQGWYIGTIVSTSKVPTANFNIKYDRAETGTVFIDGVHSVLLSMEGLQAYGRRWVVLEWIDDERH